MSLLPGHNAQILEQLAQKAQVSDIRQLLITVSSIEQVLIVPAISEPPYLQKNFHIGQRDYKVSNTIKHASRNVLLSTGIAAVLMNQMEKVAL